MSNAKSDIDWLVYKAARLPGPGQYEVDHSLKYTPAPPCCSRLITHNLLASAATQTLLASAPAAALTLLQVLNAVTDGAAVRPHWAEEHALAV